MYISYTTYTHKHTLTTHCSLEMCNIQYEICIASGSYRSCFVIISSHCDTGKSSAVVIIFHVFIRKLMVQMTAAISIHVFLLNQNKAAKTYAAPNITVGARIDIPL